MKLQSLYGYHRILQTTLAQLLRDLLRRELVLMSCYLYSLLVSVASTPFVFSFPRSMAAIARIRTLQITAQSTDAGLSENSEWHRLLLSCRVVFPRAHLQTSIILASFGLARFGSSAWKLNWPPWPHQSIFVTFFGGTYLHWGPDQRGWASMSFEMLLDIHTHGQVQQTYI